MFAAHVSAGKAQSIAEKIGQQKAWFDYPFVFDTVDSKMNSDHLTRFHCLTPALDPASASARRTNTLAISLL
jgi:hypothetical protein